MARGRTTANVAGTKKRDVTRACRQCGRSIAHLLLCSKKMKSIPFGLFNHPLVYIRTFFSHSCKRLTKKKNTTTKTLINVEQHHFEEEQGREKKKREKKIIIIIIMERRKKKIETEINNGSLRII